ncbi:MAG: tRNA (guanosine(46)-N7)-methyltransferase TrmB, partial [Phoenicibacter congonensis]|nr:tRNA (guanosine(46)-N7)-methyltransferase TrmB [Phoenicibacter congonensis]
KTKHAKRRLTAPEFLQIYRQILRDEGEIRFKTDNIDLFAWSLITFEQQGFRLLDVDHDLSEEDSGVISEYEKRFRTRGQSIYFARAAK